MPVAFSDGLVRIGTHDRVVVGVWRAPFSRERLGALRTITSDLVARHGTTVGLLGVFESESIELSALTDDTLRREAAAMQADFAGKVLGGQSIVLEGNGFAVSALRSAALALQMLSRVREKPMFHPDLRAGIDWLGERMGLPGRTKAEIAAFVAELRAG